MQADYQKYVKSFVRITALSVILTVAYFYCIPYLEIIKLYPKYFRPFSKYSAKILLVHNNGFGEQDTVERLKITARRLNIDLQTLNGHAEHHIIKHQVANILKAYHPDFILVLEDKLKYFPGAPNYIVLASGGNNRYLKQESDGRLAFSNENHKDFDAFLTAFNADLFEKVYQQSGKKYFGAQWYPTVYITDYPVASPKKLFYSGGVLWDETRNSEKYLQLFKQLDQTDYFIICGTQKSWGSVTPRALIGQIPFDGKSLIKNIHDAGVSLLLHHQEHIIGGAPTARIFEAAAANAVIISDRHPFIMQHFGDNVLYVDIDQDADSMYAQINAHMQWIFAHPEEAQHMAQNCNTIFKEKFSMEQQLLRLLELHGTVTDYAHNFSKR